MAARARRGRQMLMDDGGFRDLIADGEDRIQRRHRP